VALGNPMKLPGLQRFLSQNLDQEVKLIDSFNNLVQGSATSTPQFKENQLTFGVAYGLCVQSLELGQLRTNLLPEEIVTTRLVRAKKPWAVAAMAMLLIGMTVNYMGHYSSWKSADKEEPAMKSAIAASATAKQSATTFATEHTALTTKFDEITKIGQNLQSNVDGRLLWLEVLKAIDAALPRDTRPPEERKETVEDVVKREELHIEKMDCEYFDDLSRWYTAIQPQYVAAKKEETMKAAAAPPANGDAAQPADTASEPTAAEAIATDGAPAEAAPTDGAPANAAQPDASQPEGATPPATEAPASDGAATQATTDVATTTTGADTATDPNATAAIDPLTGQPVAGAAGGLTGPGWVIEIRGYHLHNTLREQKITVQYEGEDFILNTFFKNLETGTVKLPDGPNGKLIDVPISDLGIKYPVIVTTEEIKPVTYFPEATDMSDGGAMPAAPVMPDRGEPGIGPGATAEKEPELWKLRQYDFIIQFCWQPQPRGTRLDKKKMAQQEQPEGEAPSTAAIESDAGDSS
jgi:type IV pilus assembly protein PilM